MSYVNRWLEFLDTVHVRYSHSTHPPAQTALATADAERMPAHEFAKTVVYFSDAGFGIAVVPADQLVDLAKVGRLLGVSWIRLATEQELSELYPDCEQGAMPPFGDRCELPVILDAGLAGGFLAFTIGTHRDVVRIGFEDFQSLARPVVAAISVSQPVLV